MEQLYRQNQAEGQQSAGTADELISAAKRAAAYEGKISQLHRMMFLQYRNDIIHEGLASIYANPNIDPFIAARRAACVFIKRQIKKQGMSGNMHWFKGGIKTIPAEGVASFRRNRTAYEGWHAEGQQSAGTASAIDSRPVKVGLNVSLKVMAKFFYGLLAKGGKRGQKSAILKAYIVLERMEGRRLQAIADYTGHTIGNIQEHYKNAKKLIRQFGYDNIHLMADWQREIVMDCFFSGNDDEECVPMSKEEITTLRGEKSREDFASELGVSFFTVRNWEDGSQNPGTKSLAKLWKYAEGQQRKVSERKDSEALSPREASVERTVEHTGSAFGEPCDSKTSVSPCDSNTACAGTAKEEQDEYASGTGGTCR